MFALLHRYSCNLVTCLLFISSCKYLYQRTLCTYHNIIQSLDRCIQRLRKEKKNKSKIKETRRKQASKSRKRGRDLTQRKKQKIKFNSSLYLCTQRKISHSNRVEATSIKIFVPSFSFFFSFFFFLLPSFSCCLPLLYFTTLLSSLPLACLFLLFILFLLYNITFKITCITYITTLPFYSAQMISYKRNIYFTIYL